MALQHGGDHWVCHEVSAHDNGHDDHESAPEGGHHHHDLGAVLAEKTITVQEQVAGFVWTASDATLLAWVSASLHLAEVTPSPSASEHSPPDQRSTGWLLVSHTALQVRGPSRAA